MKKSSVVAMVMGTVGGILFALGMCMCLLPEWDAFTPGIILGAIGAVVLIAMAIIWRKMENKAPIRLEPKVILSMIVGIAGAIMLGVGMCLVMVWSSLVWGIIVGIIGIIALLSLMPIIKGIKD